MAEYSVLDGREFAFSPEQQELRAAVGRFCDDSSDDAAVRRLMQSVPAFDAGDWKRLGSELGVLGLGVPEEIGGSGGGLVDAAVVAEELGAALYCGPVVGTFMLAIPALTAAPRSPARDELLGTLVEGSRTAAFAAPDLGGVFDADALTVTAARDDSGQWRLSGDAGRVVDAADVDVLLVAAASADGVALFSVDAAQSGVHRERLSTLDQTRPQARVRFAAADATLMVDDAEAGAVCDHALRVAAVLLAAEQVGVGQRLLDLCVEYAKTRLQFGRPIGSFQAVKHRLADMLVDQEHARSAAHHGAWALQDGSDLPRVAAAIAQAVCSEAATRIARDAVQVHGGIGFTWEHRVHLYFKRASTDASLLGSAEEHRDALASLVLDCVEPTAIEIAAG